HTRSYGDWSSDVCSSDLLPDTPSRASVPDQRQARIWFDRGVPLEVVETALLLACLRRMVRPTDVPPLPLMQPRALVGFLTRPEKIGRASCRERGESRGVA